MRGKSSIAKRTLACYPLFDPKNLHRNDISVNQNTIRDFTVFSALGRLAGVGSRGRSVLRPLVCKSALPWPRPLIRESAACGKQQWSWRRPRLDARRLDDKLNGFLIAAVSPNSL
jgi:hypothetical protein